MSDPALRRQQPLGRLPFVPVSAGRADRASR